MPEDQPIIKPIAECKTLQELFADKTRWTKGAFAKSPEGFKVWACSDNATCFCFAGGAARIYPDIRIRQEIFNRVNDELGKISCIVDWNDEKIRTVEEVQELCRKLNI